MHGQLLTIVHGEFSPKPPFNNHDYLIVIIKSLRLSTTTKFLLIIISYFYQNIKFQINLHLRIEYDFQSKLWNNIN